MSRGEARLKGTMKALSQTAERKPSGRRQWAFRSMISVLTVSLLMLSAATVKASDLDKYSAAYRHLRYNNLNGFVNANGLVQKVNPNGTRSSYNAIGCSGFVIPVLNRYLYGPNWKQAQAVDWRMYQQYGDAIAEYFDLPYATSLSADQIYSSSAIQGLIADHTLRKGGKYLFNTRLDAAGHVGFIEVNANGSLSTFMFSGIGKGRDGTDVTYNPARFPKRVLAQRSAASGFTGGAFSSWYGASQYYGQPVEMYALPSGYTLRIEYSWPSTQRDLDTGTTFGGVTVGYAYPSTTNADYLTWSLDNVGAGPETVEINLQDALETGVITWSQNVTVKLAAGWYSPAGGYGNATVTASLLWDDEVYDTRTKTIRPGTQTGTATTAVGTVTVNLSTGEFSLN
jgi:hypothetical protein